MPDSPYSFSPADLPGLTLHLKADAGVITDAEGRVTRWLDQATVEVRRSWWERLFTRLNGNWQPFTAWKTVARGTLTAEGGVFVVSDPT